ncbi:MAG: T9SS type A sorting domain-containing protein [Chlorobi bacterium]|nr:T9SS type A sorting domain-containing protein [Chlorobiota bacterium]
MKTKPTLTILFLFAALQCYAQTDIIKFDCTETQSIQQGLLILQPFTMPDGDDYYITEIGVQTGDLSQSGKIYMGIYEYKDFPEAGLYLIFRSDEISFTGGANATITTPVKKGVQKLEASKTYYISLMYMGSDYLYVQKQSSAVNDGIATDLDNTLFKDNNVYPFFPNPVSTEGNWAFNTGMILKGEVIDEEIVPYNDIFDFNTTDYQEIDKGLVASSLLSVPGTGDIMVRHIGIKTDTSDASGPVKFAVYEGLNNSRLIYISDEINIPAVKRDTFYANIPESELTLKADSSYYLAIQYGGEGILHISKGVNPYSKGITTANSHSYFITETTYPNFPDPFDASGSWYFTLGFVLNSDPAIITSRQDVKSNDIKLFPVPAKDFIWVYSDNTVIPGTVINVYNMTGNLVLRSAWTDNHTSKLNISELPGGIYIIKSNEINVKFIKQ